MAGAPRACTDMLLVTCTCNVHAPCGINNRDWVGMLDSHFGDELRVHSTLLQALILLLFTYIVLHFYAKNNIYIFSLPTLNVQR